MSSSSATGSLAKSAVRTMKRYVIEREVPGVGSASVEDIKGMAAASNAAIAQLVPDIQWEHSYRTGDKFFCVYLAVDEEAIRKHAVLSGFPADTITLVASVVDPTTAA